MAKSRKAEHPDERQDRALVVAMVKPTALKRVGGAKKKAKKKI